MTARQAPQAARRVAPPWRAMAGIAVWRHGWAWPAAACLAAAAAALHGLVIPDAHHALLRAQADLADATAHARALRQRPAPVASNDASRVQDVAALVQAAPGATEIVARMSALAQAQGLGLPQADYQYETSRTAQLVHVQVTQPLRSGYPGIRRYAEAVLRNTPNASLDQIQVRRDGVAQADVQARLKWSLWLPLDAASATAAGAPSLTPRGDLIAPPAGGRLPAAGDLFLTHSWAPVVKPVVLPPVAPTAPPLPYTYLGKKLENGEWEVYLARGERTLVARQGMRLDAEYQVDGVAPPVLTLTYLPLGLTQTLPIGDTR